MTERLERLLGAIARDAIAARCMLDEFLQMDLKEEERWKLKLLRGLLGGEAADECYPEWLR